MTCMKLQWLLFVLFLALVSSPAGAEVVRLRSKTWLPKMECLFPPLPWLRTQWIYDSFNTGDFASAAVESLAELGNSPHCKAILWQLSPTP